MDKEEWETMRLQQKTNEIMGRAAFLSSDGAKAQFRQFARIKANCNEARYSVASGNEEGILAALERIEKIADLRLDVIERADSTPGGWQAAAAYERAVEAGDADSSRRDRIWKNALAESEGKRSAENSRRAAAKGRGPSNRGFRGNYNNTFRSVIHLFPLVYLCSYLVLSLE